jgi:hypothetical protein
MPDRLPVGGYMEDIYHVGINAGEYEIGLVPKFETYVIGEEAAKKLVARLKRIAKKKETRNGDYVKSKYDGGGPDWYVWMRLIIPDDPLMESELKRYSLNDND